MLGIVDSFYYMIEKHNIFNMCRRLKLCKELSRLNLSFASMCLKRNEILGWGECYIMMMDFQPGIENRG